MTIRIQLFGFIVFVYVLQTMSKENFVSCVGHADDFHVTFDCAVLDDKILHRNYFDQYVVDNTCTIDNASVVFSTLTEITLKNCRLPIMPQKFLQRLASVREIHLDNSGIKAINDAAFSYGNSLERLSMSRNDLTSVPSFAYTPNISEINFSRNRISNIGSSTFRMGTTNYIKIINLSHNNIETLDKYLFVELENLEKLFLGHNFIEHFHVDLSALSHLTELNLDNNKVARLDCTNFALSTNQVCIDVSFNFIKEIDLNCSVHIELLEINITDNQLTSLTFPKSNLLNGLTKMVASSNLIGNVTFHRSFHQLVELQLNDNILKEFVEWEDTMFPRLRRLGISGNQFNCSYLSKLLRKLPKTLELERRYEVSSCCDNVRKASKKIHGISCVDVVKKGFESENSVPQSHLVNVFLPKGLRRINISRSRQLSLKH